MDTQNGHSCAAGPRPLTNVVLSGTGTGTRLHAVWQQYPGSSHAFIGTLLTGDCGSFETHHQAHSAQHTCLKHERDFPGQQCGGKRRFIGVF
jgi:hypothetical protein